MSVNLAVFGDIHGKQDLMYKVAKDWERSHNRSLDAILQVGDFETVRDESDLAYLSAPKKYKKVGDFADYASGDKTAPILTVFIGGNHEAWNVLGEKNNGGFVAENMYYLGRAGTMAIKGVNIGGVTGIYHPKVFNTALGQEPDHDWKYYRSDAFDSLRKTRLDVLLVHDWMTPVTGLDIRQVRNIHDNLLIGKKNPIYGLMQDTAPKYVFMGHMHDAYMHALFEDSEIFCLTELNKQLDKDCFKVVSF